MKTKIITATLILSLFVISSCLKKESFPNEPAIEFKDFKKIENNTGIDNKGILKFSFTDGDGDLGLDDADTFYPYNFSGPNFYNLIVERYEKINGVMVKDTFPTKARIPVIQSSGQNKGVKGDLEIEIFFNNPLSIYDTIQLETYILDRALHKSNIIKTPEIWVDKH